MSEQRYFTLQLTEYMLNQCSQTRAAMQDEVGREYCRPRDLFNGPLGTPESRNFLKRGTLPVVAPTACTIMDVPRSYQMISQDRAELDLRREA